MDTQTISFLPLPVLENQENEHVFNIFAFILELRSIQMWSDYIQDRRIQ